MSESTVNSSPAPARGSGGRKPRVSAIWSFAHLAVLATFAVAQPLFDLLGKNPEFFAARGSTTLDIISFAVLLVVAPPALLVAVELIAGAASGVVREGMHLLFVGGLVGLIAAQALKKAIDASDAALILGSCALALATATAYARAAGLRSFLSALTPAPLLFLVLFLVFSPASELLFTSDAGAQSIGGSSRAPIVVLMFDEFPSNSLLDDRRQVDPVRYPGFASLARDATWFRNAYTVYDSTERALPAIMDGDYPSKSRLPSSSDHPNSIFSLLGKTHRLNVSEESTNVCSRELCRDARVDEPYPTRMRSLAKDLGLVWLHVVAPPQLGQRLANVSQTWGDFGAGQSSGGGGEQRGPDTRANLNGNRNKRLDAWIASVRPSRRPTFNFKDVLLPHLPWQYLPDGRQYRRTANDAIPGLSDESYNAPRQIDSLWQRHLLQTGFADHELAKLIDHLKRTGLYEKSLILVAADHGVAFDVGKRDRRTLTPKNFGEIAPIPLFIKAPYQRRGRIDDSYVETVDILPTILDILKLHPHERPDGSSAFSPKVRSRRTIRIFQRATFKPLRFSAAKFEQAKRVVARRKQHLLGVGRDGPLRMFRLGPESELLFRATRGYPISAGSGARFLDAGEYRNVDLRSATIPVHVTGRLSGTPSGRDLAIAVNGRIAATTRSFHLATDNSTVFAAMVPESFFRQGNNRVELYAVTRPNGTPALTRLGRG